MATMREPKEVVQRFLDHGSTADGWNMEVISECFSEHYEHWGGLGAGAQLYRALKEPGG